MVLKTSYSLTLTSQGTLGGGTLYTGDLPLANFNQITSLVGVDTVVTYTGVPKAQVIKANADINLTGVETITGVTLNKVASGNGIAKVAVSVDGGATYKVFNGSAWVTLDVTDVSAFKTNGMTSTVINAITDTQWTTLRGSSNTLRFAYVLDRLTVADGAEHDDITVVVTMAGVSSICNTSKYTMTYNEGTKTISYVFNTSGTYTFNYLD
jgi:hypothetical protein